MIYRVNSFFLISCNILKNILLSIAMLMKTDEKDRNDYPKEESFIDWNDIDSLKN